MRTLVNHPVSVFDDINRLFGMWDVQNEAQQSGKRHWQPAIDIRQTQEGFVLHADLPGVTSNDLEISVDDNTLMIQGEKHYSKVEEGEQAITRERAHGRFLRRFTLPEGIDASAITASFKHGVLELAIPKAVKVTPTRIPVHVDSE